MVNVEWLIIGDDNQQGTSMSKLNNALYVLHPDVRHSLVGRERRISGCSGPKFIGCSLRDPRRANSHGCLEGCQTPRLSLDPVLLRGRPRSTVHIPHVRLPALGMVQVDSLGECRLVGLDYHRLFTGSEGPA